MTEANRVRAAVVEAAESCGYRVSESTWAGGEHTTRVEVYTEDWKRPRASGEATRAWSRNRKWTGTNSEWNLAVPHYWLTRIARFGIGVVDGLLTLDAKRVSKRDLPPGMTAAWEATWVVQSRGVDLRTERGVIVEARYEDSAGIEQTVHMHGSSLKSAARNLQRRIEAEREAVDATHSRLADWPEEALDITMTVRDSHKAGNCPTGTRDWVARHMTGRRTATVREVLTRAYASGDRVALVERAVRIAVRRAEGR